ncbi:WXG100 family type VII secretion target [Nocardia blacklockiae]|uniref:WXG100 family type VII secretion target n=1 Tax=Nocardia blacklockiae TaxID=480036 RepID=UPI0018943026|nr:hypothetical protein [Nocardia blacklockiae]MBF6171425.1 hypothetical protein [Nocardia blacklockiae]
MAERIEVDPAKLRAAAQVTQDLSDRVKGVADRLRGTLSGLEFDAGNRPWGDDSMGKKFSEGDKGYKGARTNLLDGADAMVQTLHDFAEGQRNAAAVMQGVDGQSANDFGGSNAS